MAGKSRREKAKRSARGKRKKGTLARVVRQPVSAETHKSSASPVASAAPSDLSAGERYSYVVTDLRRIGILGGVILAILVVLYLVLP